MNGRNIEKAVTVLLLLNKSERTQVFTLTKQLHDAERTGIDLKLRQQIVDEYFGGK